MNKIKNIIAISAFSLMVLALPAVASAQYGGNNRGNFPGGVYGGGNLEGVAQRLKDRSRDFERQVDRERFGNRGGILGGILSGGIGNRGYNSNRLRSLAEDFRKAADQFENRVDGGGNNRRDNYRDLSRGEQAAQRMLSIGSQIDREMNSLRGNSSLRYQWNAIENDLRIVANAYRNNNRGGGRNGRFPF
ncbi:MAG TPA: hypothetical protein VJ781_07035 [Pyrinomonadaceae bacterium]|nr:hypothetical protein [Pyrinomonadaceae bacterium]